MSIYYAVKVILAQTPNVAPRIFVFVSIGRNTSQYIPSCIPSFKLFPEVFDIAYLGYTKVLIKVLGRHLKKGLV